MDDSAFEGTSTVGKANFATLGGAALNDYAKVLNFGKGFAGKLKSVESTYSTFKPSISAIHTSGTTALGPGALAAIGLAIGNEPEGSQIILCTDGMANLGIGSFSRGGDAVAKQFYQQIGELASEHGISINLITFKGDEANIQTLSEMCEISGGEVEMMEVGNAGDMIGDMFNRRTIAVNVEAQVKLHKALEFRNEDTRQMSHNNKTLVKKLRNVDADTEFTFEYRLRDLD